MVYPHSSHPWAAGRVQDRVSSPAKDRRSANCATQPIMLDSVRVLNFLFPIIIIITLVLIFSFPDISR